MLNTTTVYPNSSFSQRIGDFLRRKPVIVQLLRFAAIGSLNTALDFIILNYITKSFDITSGTTLGVLNVVSFTAAIIQSYFWNRAWAFAESQGLSVFQNAYRLILVGGLGFVAFASVVIGAAYNAYNLYFLFILIGFVIVEIILWKAFNLKFGDKHAGAQFATFVAVSLVGLLINSLVVVFASSIITPYLEFTINADTIKNVAKIMATAFSLIWNFLAYKLIVFRK